jgi:lantibiotic modifying enzyme
MEQAQFRALVEAAASLDDLRDERFFVVPAIRRNRELLDVLRSTRAEKRSALEAWSQSEAISHTVRLRDSNKLPRWAQQIRELFASLPGAEIPGHGSLAQRLVQPAIAYASAQLRRRLTQQHLDALVHSAAIASAEKQLERTFVSLITPCLDLHLRAFENALQSLSRWRHVPATEVEDQFVGHDSGERLIALLGSFPPLAKLCAQVIGDWQARLFELASRFSRDRKAIERAFFERRNVGPIRGITLDISDPHRRGRESMILHFEKDRIVYKPRSGRSEADWFVFLQWTNREGFQEKFRTVRLLRRRTYHWAGYVAHCPCASSREVRAYYRRAGGIICAAYFLGAVDCHCENLIAVGDQPVLIDAETLFHPQTSPEMARSLYRTGLLPSPGFVSTRAAALSAFGSNGDGPHVPSYSGKNIPAKSHTADIEQGFTAMWKIIGEPSSPSRQAFEQQARRLAAQQWRRVHYPTEYYADIRERSLSPKALRTGLERSRQLALDLLRPTASAETALAEMKALERFDIPFFSAVPRQCGPDNSPSDLADLLKEVETALAAT